jgi:hypothetical protein
MDIDVTIFLSRLVGIFCLVMGASMLRRDAMMEIFRELSRQRALPHIMGVLMLLLGLITILAHTKWESYPAMLITLLGWGVCFEATVFLFASKEMVAKYLSTLENKTVYYLIALGYLLVGGYLAYSGFAA